MEATFTACALQQLVAAAAAESRPRDGNKGQKLPASQITAGGFFFQFADLVTDKLTVATEAYWVHSQNIFSAAGLYAHI